MLLPIDARTSSTRALPAPLDEASEMLLDESARLRSCAKSGSAI